ncbi:MAG: YraN family protein, partial [Spirochaetes bacterium]|nr:YraN family protein [Spirochaetota bacterium]
MNKKDLGRVAEKEAEAFLRKRGYDIIGRNFRSRFGEIDLIGLEKKYLVFIEVKMRSKGSFIDIFYSVNRTKMRRIVKTAKVFLMM